MHTHALGTIQEILRKTDALLREKKHHLKQHACIHRHTWTYAFTACVIWFLFYVNKTLRISIQIVRIRIQYLSIFERQKCRSAHCVFMRLHYSALQYMSCGIYTWCQFLWVSQQFVCSHGCMHVRQVIRTCGHRAMCKYKEINTKKRRSSIRLEYIRCITYKK
jgi:hypothetical protein